MFIDACSLETRSGNVTNPCSQIFYKRHNLRYEKSYKRATTMMLSLNCNGNRLCLCILGRSNSSCARAGHTTNNKLILLIYKYPTNLYQQSSATTIIYQPKSTDGNNIKNKNIMLSMEHGFKKYRHCGSDDVMQWEN